MALYTWHQLECELNRILYIIWYAHSADNWCQELPAWALKNYNNLYPVTNWDSTTIIYTMTWADIRWWLIYITVLSTYTNHPIRYWYVTFFFIFFFLRMQSELMHELIHVRCADYMCTSTLGDRHGQTSCLDLLCT